LIELGSRQFGMSDKIGPLAIGDTAPMFMGRMMAEGTPDWSPEIKKVGREMRHHKTSHQYAMLSFLTCGMGCSTFFRMLIVGDG